MFFPITSNVQGLKVRTWRGAGINQGFPGGSVVENLPASAGDMGSVPESGGSLEEEMATHSSILAWEIPWTRGALKAAVHGVTQGIRHDLVTKLQQKHIN